MFVCLSFSYSRRFFKWLGLEKINELNLSFHTWIAAKRCQIEPPSVASVKKSLWNLNELIITFHFTGSTKFRQILLLFWHLELWSGDLLLCQSSTPLHLSRPSHEVDQKNPAAAWKLLSWTESPGLKDAGSEPNTPPDSSRGLHWM